MTKIRRNEPCPCGSGKKYKRCCLHRQVPPEDRENQEFSNPYPYLTLGLPGAEGAHLALAWLEEHHEMASNIAAARIYFAGLSDDEVAAIISIPGQLFRMIDCNGKELLLAEGELELEAGTVSCLDLVLGPDGPPLSNEQRGYLELLGQRHMSFYEVVESRPGSGVSLRDLVNEDEPVRWVGEATLSRQRVGKVGARFGARLMPGDPWRMSGAAYSTQEPHTSYLIGRIRAALEGAASPAAIRQAHSQFIVFGWLHAMARLPPSYFADAGSVPS